MKTQRIIVTFACDVCDKRVDSEKGFPYGLGWHYLFDVNIQIPFHGEDMESHVRLCEKDKHFCSKECLLRFVEKMTLKG